METMKYKGYLGSVEVSEADNCLFGKVLGMSKSAITYEGQTVAELRTDFEQAVEFYLAQCTERGMQPEKPFSGAMNIRIPVEVHEKLAAVAGKLGTSINSVIKNALTEFTKHAL